MHSPTYTKRISRVKVHQSWTPCDLQGHGKQMFYLPKFASETRPCLQGRGGGGGGARANPSWHKAMWGPTCTGCQCITALTYETTDQSHSRSHPQSILCFQLTSPQSVFALWAEAGIQEETRGEHANSIEKSPGQTRILTRNILLWQCKPLYHRATLHKTNVTLLLVFPRGTFQFCLSIVLIAHGTNYPSSKRH